MSLLISQAAPARNKISSLPPPFCWNNATYIHKNGSKASTTLAIITPHLLATTAAHHDQGGASRPGHGPEQSATRHPNRNIQYPTWTMASVHSLVGLRVHQWARRKTPIAKRIVPEKQTPASPALATSMLAPGTREPWLARGAKATSTQPDPTEPMERMMR